MTLNKDMDAMEMGKGKMEFAKALIDTSLDPLVALNPAGEIIDLNAALVSLTGTSRTQLIGADLSHCFTEPQKARRAFQHVLDTGSIIDYPLCIKHENGGETQVLYNARTSYGNDGEVLGVFVTTRNIQQQLEQQKEILALKEELAFHKNELETFSYSVSHDLRAPLRAVDGFVAMFLSKFPEDIDAEGQRLLETVRKNVKQMGTLMDQLLLLSGTGIKGLQITNINMNELAHAVVEECNTSKGKAVIKIHDLPAAKGDIPLVRQMFVNLIENAIKFSAKKETPQIEIGCEKRGTENYFYVRDNGIGFNMEYAHKLFDVFQQLCDPQEYSGTGMGLAMVKRIAKLHGGKVHAEGIENEGATFYFSLRN